MSSFSVTSNYYLRSMYSSNRNLIKSSNRALVSNATLNEADATALKKAISTMEKFDYDDTENTDETTLSTSSKVKYGHTLKAFMDTYNYTMQSASKSSSAAAKKMTKEMKALTSAHQTELEDLGVEIDKSGYMSLADSSVDIDLETYGTTFGPDSDFMKMLNTYNNQMLRHIDTTA